MKNGAEQVGRRCGECGEDGGGIDILTGKTSVRVSFCQTDSRRFVRVIYGFFAVVDGKAGGAGVSPPDAAAAEPPPSVPWYGGSRWGRAERSEGRTRRRGSPPQKRVRRMGVVLGWFLPRSWLVLASLLPRWKRPAPPCTTGGRAGHKNQRPPANIMQDYYYEE